MVATADGSAATASQRVRRQQETETGTSSMKKTIGLAVNGGSASAANGCGSFMRGFQQQMVTMDGEQKPALQAFKHISGLSGGNFASVMYHYARYTTSDEILDATGNSDPSKITMDSLEDIPEKSLFSSLVKELTASVVAGLILSLLLGGTLEVWPLILSLQFLQPRGIATGTKLVDAKIRDDVGSTPLLMTSMLGPAETFPNYEFYTMSRGMMLELFNNHQTELQKIEWPGYPELNYYQMDNDYLLQLAEKHNYQFPFPAILSDQGLVVPFTKEVAIKYDNVENMTADDVNFMPVDSSFAELDQSGNSQPFTVDKMLGMATDVLIIYAQIFNAIEVFQQVKEINVDVPTADGPRTMVFSDGGYNEGTGIPPLVRMKTDKIISVYSPNSVNADVAYNVVIGYTPFFGMNDYNNIPFMLDSFLLASGTFNHMFDLYSNGENQILKLIANFESLKAAGVRMKTDKIISVWSPNSVNADVTHNVQGYSSFFGMNDHNSIPSLLDYFPLASGPFNHMFDLYSNGENQILKLIANFESLKAAGEPMITTLKNVTVVDNPFYGIEGGWTLDLTIILAVGVPQKVVELIPEDIVTPPPGRNVTENGYFTNEEFATVPNVQAAPIGLVNLSLPLPFTDETIDFPFMSVGNNLPVKEARMTQIINSWIISHAWEGLEGADGEVQFEGFKKIFEEVLEEDDGGMTGSTFSDGGQSASSAPMVSFMSACVVSMTTAIGMMMYFTVESFF
eukprot:CAMPEP_0183327796 /NCGR_PEP_ID=MMETSP0160_2-20130417/83951_1 /TAXON_ID=2839 ORGANISM="Odontella Sinensis, Strain Grunow 1884" /NCGR_SAMPLE_ID=MMETSP0160_2 /ASSEMBLY_ACC=CAM_ASM_000250 /LENGTH=737 /DNA_ID=CAMNT_0025495941 /DNA_START=107 /DNA_END=2320 /DNA_ORIENTATION=+